MLKPRLSFLKTAIFAVAVTLCVAQVSQAQFGVFVGGGGGHRGGGTQWGVSVGTPLYGGAYYGSGYRYGGYPYYGNTYYSPSVYGYNYAAPYTYSYPYSSVTYAPNNAYSLPANAYTSFYYAPDSGNGASGDQTPNSATIQVIVPSNAKLWFGGSATQQTGPVRFFTTPALTEGRTSTYEVQATWKDSSGTDVTRTRTIHVAPNQQTMVNFMDSERSTTSGGTIPNAGALPSGGVSPQGGTTTPPRENQNPVPPK